MRPEAEDNNDLEGTSDQPGGDWGSQSTNASQKAPSPSPLGVSYPQGLAPTDLTSLPDESRELITWLARRKMANLEEMEQGLNRKRASIVKTLEELLPKGYVRELTIEGMNFYRVVFHSKPRRGPRGLREDLWNRLELKPGEPQED
jgi:hypothetical protein